MTFCDLGESVNLIPLSICNKIYLIEMKSPNISLQLVDKTIKDLVGILEDMPIRIGQLFTSIDFVIIKMEENSLINNHFSVNIF